MTCALNADPVAAPESDGLDLISRARQGDCGAYDELCRLHGDRLLRQAVALCGGMGLAEDLVQETLIAAWRSLPRYRDGCRFFTWLCSIMIHRHRNTLRRKRPFSFSFLFGGQPDEPAAILANLPDPGATPDAEAAQADQAARVLRSLDKLPVKQREVVYLRFYAEESLEGIAAALGCPVGTVKSRLFHGLERIRRMEALPGSKDL